MIKFVMDLESQTWSISGEAESKMTILDFYIDMIPGKTPFKNFDYYFDILGKNIEDLEFILEPPENILEKQNFEDKETTFPYLVNRHFVKNLLPDEKYTIKVSCKNRREFFRDEFSFLTPLPEKPHKSWKWDLDKKEWVAPVAPPSLIWDEDSQQWILS